MGQPHVVITPAVGLLIAIFYSSTLRGKKGGALIMPNWHLSFLID